MTAPVEGDKALLLYDEAPGKLLWKPRSAECLASEKLQTQL